MLHFPFYFVMNNKSKQWRWGSAKKAVMNYFMKNPDTKPLEAYRNISPHYPYKYKGQIDKEKRKKYTSDRHKLNSIVNEFYSMELLTTKGRNKNLLLIGNPIVKSGCEKYYFERQKILPGKKLRLNKQHSFYQEYTERYC